MYKANQKTGVSCNVCYVHSCIFQEQLTGLTRSSRQQNNSFLIKHEFTTSVFKTTTFEQESRLVKIKTMENKKSK